MSKRIHFMVGSLLSCLAVLLVLSTPQSAFARDVSMDKTDIKATVQTDGSLDVVETRSVHFEGSYSLIYFDFGALNSGSTIQIDGAQISDGGRTQTLSEVPFKTSWRDSGGPGSAAYSYDSAKNTLYVFNNWNNTTAQITISYTITGEVTRYNDCAVLYWKYVKENWPVDSKNVHLQIILPPHDASEAKEGDTLRFWGHASDNNSGELHFDKANQTIEVSNSTVHHGSWAEVRVMMPAPWLSEVKLGDSNYKSLDEAQKILDEEQEWASWANTKRWLLRLVNIPIILLACALVVYGVRNYLRYGREPKPLFTDQYWRDVPSAGVDSSYGLPKDLHPALVYANDHDGSLDETAFNASVVRLAAKKVLSFNAMGNGEWMLEYHPNVPGVTLTDIDQVVLDFLFKNLFNERRTVVTQAEIEQVTKDDPGSITKGYDDWEKLVTQYYHAYQFEEPMSKQKSRRQKVMGIIFVVIAFGGASYLTEWTFFSFALLLLASVYLIISARSVRRATQMSADLKACSKALKNWLLDFTALGDKPPTDVIVWGYFMTYATLYGISQQVIANVAATSPEIFNDPEMQTFTQMMGYGPHGVGFGDNHINLIDAFEQSFTEAVTNATFALSKDADGGGSGGGFSFGGGGGSGGGGGGGFR